MLPKIEGHEEDGNNLSKDVEAITKEFSIEKSLTRNSKSSSSKCIENDPNLKSDKQDNNSKKDKKSSIWSLKLLRAISFTRSKKFNCCFSLQVHFIKGLPLSFNDLYLCVHWKRRHEHLVTIPAKVIQGIAKFKDILSCTCFIVGRKNGFDNSAQYEAEHFLLDISVFGVPEINLGKHQLDITRMLPLSLKDLEKSKSSGEWSTGFRLSGKAKGAMMSVTFDYMVIDDNGSTNKCIDDSPTDFNSKSEPESPRERLLRQFEEEVGYEVFSLFDADTSYDDEDEGDCGSCASFEFSTGILPSSLSHDLQEGLEFEDVRRKPKGHILEDLETEALRHEWGFNEEAFQHSPPKDFAGFGSPIYQLPEEPPRLPPLAEGFGPFLQTKDGGFLRSMNPSLFLNSKSGENLIMQVSNPVVMPANLHLSESVGIEKLSMQANKFMSPEDITGKTMQQISWEAMPSLEGKDRQWHLQPDLVTQKDSTCVQRDLKGSPSRLKSDEIISSSIGNQGGSGFFSLEDVAPLAMDKIEALSMEGFKIQSGISEEDAPSNIIAGNNNSDEDDECEIRAEVEMKDNQEERSTKESAIAQFRNTGVHVAGLKIKSHIKKLWGTSNQQQAGSRWSFAKGMCRSNKIPWM